MKNHIRKQTYVAAGLAIYLVVVGGCREAQQKKQVADIVKTGAFSRLTIDLGTVVSDVEKSAKFYTEALGFTEVPGFDVSPEMAGDSGLTDYKPFKVRVFVLGEGDTATRIKLMEIAPTGAKVDNTYINSSLGFSYLTIFVTDTTASVERAVAAGAKIVKPPLVLGDGVTYLTVIKDPDGNNVEFVGPKK
ncbi:MAG: VOC family protein [Phycisphaerae bacterium]|nr:VOC family protein [Phycisphaerae bacterium]